jgi:hypothetical protein
VSQSSHGSGEAEDAAGGEPDLALAEEFFVKHGLPYFVDSIRSDVHAKTRRSRLLLVVGTAVLVGVVAAVAVGWAVDEPGAGLAAVAVTIALVLVLGYALVALHAGAIASWAGRRTFASLGILFPLVTRALPLLLLFVTFLFINAEVWEVSARLDGSVMWLTIALFLVITVGFLLVRLPEELEVFDSELDLERIRSGTHGTPLEGWHQSLEQTLLEEIAEDEIEGLQRANLILVLLIAQLVQVLLLSLAVFVFFVIFGVLIMHPQVIEGWTGQNSVTSVPWAESLPWFQRANLELLQVSIFLAAFSGLYFTVYAVTDDVYRRQFFTSILRELERAVSARVVYRALLRT